MLGVVVAVGDRAVFGVPQGATQGPPAFPDFLPVVRVCGRSSELLCPPVFGDTPVSCPSKARGRSARPPLDVPPAAQCAAVSEVIGPGPETEPDTHPRHHTGLVIRDLQTEDLTVYETSCSQKRNTKDSGTCEGLVTSLLA